VGLPRGAQETAREEERKAEEKQHKMEYGKTKKKRILIRACAKG